MELMHLISLHKNHLFLNDVYIIKRKMYNLIISPFFNAYSTIGGIEAATSKSSISKRATFWWFRLIKLVG